MAIKSKGGRPRKDGVTAKPRLRDPKTGRMLKDTPDNRKRVGFVDGSQVDSSRPAESKNGGGGVTTPPTKTTAPLERGHEQGAAAVADSLGAGPEVKKAPDGKPTAEVDYKAAVTIFDMIVSSQVPSAKMEPTELNTIGLSLDQVIAKRWPSLKQQGPEFALALALSGWLARILLVPMITKKPDTEEKHPVVDSSSENVNPELAGDPFAGTGDGGTG